MTWHYIHIISYHLCSFILYIFYFKTSISPLQGLRVQIGISGCRLLRTGSRWMESLHRFPNGTMKARKGWMGKTLQWMILHVYILYIYIRIYICMYVCIYLSIYPSINPSIHPSIYLSIYPCVCVYIYVYIYMYIDLYIFPQKKNYIWGN